ncbi:uncharacterized protein V6R79_003899 [Siganus canaliculatus]
MLTFFFFSSCSSSSSSFSSSCSSFFFVGVSSGIEHVKGFRVYLEDKNPDGKQCQHLILKDPRQLNFSFRSTVGPEPSRVQVFPDLQLILDLLLCSCVSSLQKLSSQPFSGLTFDTDYMVRVVPFPSLMNESFFPPSFLRTNSCEILLGADNLVCKPFWRPKTLNVSQLGSSLLVAFDQAPSSFGFHFYYLYFKLRQEGPFRLQRCRPDVSQLRTTCVLQDVAPGTYTIELRDDSNTTRRQTQYHVSQVHSPWAGPIRAMAITVPLVILSAFATLFTVMCRKKQQENIYSQLDEESSESSNQSAALSAERPWPRPRVFLCYSSRDGPRHQNVVQSFAFFLQDFCGCEVVLDLWEHLDMCREGHMTWIRRRLDESDFIITVCSTGLRYFVEKKSRRGKTPVGRRGNSSISTAGGGDLFVVGVAMIAEKLRQAKQSEGGGAEELSRYMAVYFDYSTESDVPAALSLAPTLKLMDQLPQLLARLHQGAPAERELAPLGVSRRNYFRSKSGRSLYVAICNMHQHISQNPDWFQTLLGPPPAAAAKAPPPAPPASADPAPPPPPKHHAASQRAESALLLNEVEVRTPPLDEGMGGARKSVLVLAPPSSPGSGPGPGPGPCPSPALPRCSLSLLGTSSRSSSELPPEEPASCSSSSSSSSSSSGLQQGACPAPSEDGGPSPPEPPPPRDSGIYDSSVPSSELSIPLMEGLSHDQADSASLAGSESSSSGLGDEELPVVTVTALSCGAAATVCEAELHHQRHLEHGDGLAPVASS